MSEQSRKLYKDVKVKVTKEQLIAVDTDAELRYPERHGTTGQKRGRNPAFRDILDFWMRHYDLFLSEVSMNR